MDFRNPNVTYQAKLDLDAKTVWTAFEDFGGWIKWSPLFSKMTLEQCFKNQVTEPTYFRDVETIFGHIYREELVHRDGSNFEMIFRQVKTGKSNPLIDRYETMLTLEPINAESCNIIWKSNIALVQAAPTGALEQVLARQKTYFKKNTLAASTSLYVQGFTKLALTFLHEKSLELQGHLLVGNASPTYEYESYSLDPVEWPMPKYCRGLPLKEALPPKKIGFMVQRTLELGYLQAAKFILEDAPDVPTNFDYEGAARKLASTYGNDKEKELTAALLKNYDTEEEFCQQFLAGINPLLIEVIKNLDQLPVKMRAHTIQDFDGKTKTAQALFQEKRLFIVDFHELKKFQQHKKMYFYAPILVLYKEILDEGESRLNVFAIQVERTENAPIFYPNSPHPNRYKLAKMFVACADVQVHQFGFHLAISHYGNEPVAVAVNRKLPEGHPMRALLLPHFNNTIGINYGARNALVPRPEIALTNYNFSVGTIQGQQLASTVWRRFHFFDFSFPKQLEARGFYRDGRDGVDNYHFRDDGFKLWDAIGNYTQNFVHRLYQSDQEVANDKDLQAFCYDLSTPEFGNYPGFPTQILTRDLLWQVLQIIIWNASALHSFLNYPQWPYVGLINNRHNALYKPMPAEDGKDITDEYIKESLAPTFASLFQLTFCWLLSGLDEDDTLVTLRSLKDFYPDIDNRFQIELQQVTKQIEKRNEKLVAQGKIPYVFLMPENVANSCNI